MENKITNIIFCIVFSTCIITVSCTRKICMTSDTYTKIEYLDTLSLNCNFIKRCSDKEIYIIDPIDSNLLCDVNKLFYYKGIDSNYILVFNSWINEKNYIAIIQNKKLDLLQCNDLFEICETHYPNKLVIEVYDSLQQFDTLSYGLHSIVLENKLILYNYSIPKN